MHVDKPGEVISGQLGSYADDRFKCILQADDDLGPSGIEYPSRFFARDYAGNLLEFSV